MVFLTVISISSSARIRAAYETASSEVDIVGSMRCALNEYYGSLRYVVVDVNIAKRVCGG